MAHVCIWFLIKLLPFSIAGLWIYGTLGLVWLPIFSTIYFSLLSAYYILPYYFFLFTIHGF